MRYVEERDLKRAQRKKLTKIIAELNKDRPSDERAEDLKQARRIFDTAVRKSFARASFDINAASRPQNPVDDPAGIVACRSNAVAALLQLLTPAQRKTAVEKASRRKTQRQGTPISLAADAGL